MMDIRCNEILEVSNINRYVIEDPVFNKIYGSGALCSINSCQDCIFKDHIFNSKSHECKVSIYFKTRTCNIIMDFIST